MANALEIEIDIESDKTHPSRLTTEEMRTNNYKHLILSGARSPYALAPDDIHIPTPSIKGKLPVSVEYGVTQANSFTAYINRETGMLRIDNMECSPFWMEIPLGDFLKK
jgi:hypothetical protein